MANHLSQELDVILKEALSLTCRGLVPYRRPRQALEILKAQNKEKKTRPNSFISGISGSLPHS